MFTAVAAFFVASPASVQAVPTMYQYTGNPFTAVTAPYTTSDFVAGMFKLAVPLAPNMPLTDQALNLPERVTDIHTATVCSADLSDKFGYSNCVILRETCKLADLDFRC